MNNLFSPKLVTKLAALLMMWLAMMFGAPVVYPKAREKMLDDLTGTVKAVLLKNTYTYNDAHDFLDDITAGHRVATATLAGVTTTNGVFDANDITFTGVTGTVNDQANAIVIYVQGADDASSRIYAYVDNFTPNPIYLTPNATTVTVTLPTEGIFTLG